MATLSLKHLYVDAAVLKSSDWNDEFNMILQALGYNISDGFTYPIYINGLSDGSNNPILKLNNNFASAADILTVETDSGGTNFLSIGNQGTFVTDGFFGTGDHITVQSSIKCPNLNADLLNGVDITGLQTNLYAFNTIQVFYPLNTLSLSPDTASWICPQDGGIITKLKIKQEGVATGDASTVIRVAVNGTFIGDASIAGNTTAVQTNDIADVPINANDIVTFLVITYAGTTKHTDVTAMVHYKKKFSI